MSVEYSAKTCDLYLNMIKICFPKFSKATLTKQVEGKCFVKLNVARKCVRRVFPVKKTLKFQVGRLKLRQDIFDELYMTVNRISKPRIGVDFDIMTETTAKLGRGVSYVNTLIRRPITKNSILIMCT